jgi:HEAT repeat protein
MTLTHSDLLKPFMEKVNHPDPVVRLEGARMLGNIWAAESCNALFHLLLDTDSRVQDAAVDGLINHGKHSGDAVAAQAVKYLGETRQDVRMRISNLFIALGPHSLEPLVLELRSPEPRHRWLAAEILGLLGEPEAGSALIEAMADEDCEVVVSAAQAMGKLKITDAVDPIISAYRRYPDMGSVFAEALGRIGSYKAVSFLLIRLANAAGLEVFTITEALGRIGSSQAMDTLLFMLSTAKGMLLEVTWKSILSIAQKNKMDILSLLGTAQVSDRLKDIFWHDGEEDVLAQLSRALQETSTSRGILILASQFANFPKEIRRVLAQALGEIGGMDAVRCLINAMDDDDIIVVYHAAESLAQIGGKQAEKALRDMMGSKNEVKILAAVQALHNKRVDPYIVPLHQLTAHENPGIHQAVHKTINSAAHR